MIEIDCIHLLIAFAGGITGAAFGGLNAFILCGLASIIGTTVFMITGQNVFNEVVTWGPFLGPHVAFAGGVAASAYAARHETLCSGRNVLVALFGFNSPKILLVGGFFGVFGYLINTFLILVPSIHSLPWTNTIALSIIISGFICRILFGYAGIFGSVPEGRSRWKRSREEAWQPWPSHPFQVFLIGAGISILAAYMVKLVPGSTGLFFGIAALSLVCFQFGAKIPVILHIALSTEMVVSATGSIGWGLVFGFLAAFLSELFACVFLIHADTHIDPPAMSLVVTYSLFPILTLVNFLTVPGAVSVVLAVIVGIGGFIVMHILRGKG